MSRKPGKTSVFPRTELTAAQDSSGLVRLFTNRKRLPARFVIALLITELCGLYLLEWPFLFNFNKFAFWDWGGYLVAHYLIQRGGAPVTGFGWQYGLLPLLIQELWFRCVKASPASFLMLGFPCALLFTAATARFANLVKNVAAPALLLLTFPFILALGADVPHALEPAPLSAGLLAQARGKREQALALSTAACFTKPVMGYLYGLVLLIFVVADLRRQNKLAFAGLLRAFLPAICTGLGLALLVGITFGWTALFKSLIPLAGAHGYRVLHYGWTGIARGLFYFPGMRPAYYIGTPVTFLVCATFYLISATALTGWRSLRNRRRAPANYEIVLTCALLHLGFLACFYGAPASWTYYAYILVMGVAATAAWTLVNRRLVWGLCILAVCGNYGTFKSSIVAWTRMTPSSATAGLFVAPAELVEWKRVTAMVKDENTAIFTWDGGAEVLFPWLRKPVGAFIVPGVATGSEIRQKLQQLRSARMVIIPTIPELGNPVTNWPSSEFQDVFANASCIFKGDYFKVYERKNR